MLMIAIRNDIEFCVNVLNVLHLDHLLLLTIILLQIRPEQKNFDNNFIILSTGSLFADKYALLSPIEYKQRLISSGVTVADAYFFAIFFYCSFFFFNLLLNFSSRAIILSYSVCSFFNIRIE